MELDKYLTDEALARAFKEADEIIATTFGPKVSIFDAPVEQVDYTSLIEKIKGVYNRVAEKVEDIPFTRKSLYKENKKNSVPVSYDKLKKVYILLLLRDGKKFSSTVAEQVLGINARTIRAAIACLKRMRVVDVEKTYIPRRSSRVVKLLRKAKKSLKSVYVALKKSCITRFGKYFPVRQSILDAVSMMVRCLGENGIEGLRDAQIFCRLKFGFDKYLSDIYSKASAREIMEIQRAVLMYSSFTVYGFMTNLAWEYDELQTAEHMAEAHKIYNEEIAA